MRRHRIAALVVSAVVVTLAAVAAQSSVGHIRGIVQDGAGGVLPGVEVRIAPAPSETRGERAAGVPERKTMTDANGRFSFLGIAPGRYTVTAVLAGFNSATVITDVPPGDTIKLALVLEVGSLAESVTVTGASPRIARQSTRQSGHERAGPGSERPIGGRSHLPRAGETPS